MSGVSRYSPLLAAAWAALILAFAPGAAVVRPILANPVGYWAAFLVSAGLAAFLLRALAPPWREALRLRPWLTMLGTTALVAFVLFEFGFRARIPVERFHFLLFGVLGVLLAAHCRSGWLGAAEALALCGAVAALDELAQAYLASRVGDPADILLDLEASATGVVFWRLCGIAAPPARPARTLLAAAIFTALLAWLMSEARWGYTISLPGGTFFSAYSPGRLLDLSRQRNYLVRPAPGSNDHFAFKDRYYIEGLAKLKQRNDWVQTGQWPLALFDNSVLETYYSPILDAKSGRWNAAMLTHVLGQASGTAPLAPTYGASGPARVPLLAASLGFSALLAGAALALRKRPRPSPEPGETARRPSECTS